MEVSSILSEIVFTHLLDQFVGKLSFYFIYLFYGLLVSFGTYGHRASVLFSIMFVLHLMNLGRKLIFWNEL